jgi:predicted dienelactone hydrolase
MNHRKHSWNAIKKALGVSIISTAFSTVAFQAIAVENNTAPIADNVYHTMPTAAIPDLAEQGQYKVGVRTLTITNPHLINPLTQKETPRQLKLEIWYPANIQNESKKTIYSDVTRTLKPFSIKANAYRDVDVLHITNTKFPLVVLSHGYTGYRTLMHYLGEHLASNGYIVAAIDHTDSTNADIDYKKSPYAGFPSTLLNRSKDQQFTRDYLLKQNTFLSAVIDPQVAGLVGYSMGGYGAVKSAGGCYNFTDATTSQFTGVKDKEIISVLKTALNNCPTNNSQADKNPTWQAIVAMAPWGEQYKLFNEASLHKITTPLLYVSGNLDDVAFYPSIRELFQQTGGKNTFLLTYENARHNIAPHPAPQIAYANEFDLGHYNEPVWGNEQLNTNNKHFVLAMMNCYVKKQQSDCRYLNLPKHSAGFENGKEIAPWVGFDKRYSLGMMWESKK